MEDPPEELIRLVTAPLHEGRYTAAVIDQFRGLLKSAFKEMIREAVHERLSSALASNEPVAEPSELEPSEPDVVTTQEEMEGFMMVKAIVAGTIKPGRVHMRDQKSYCGILVDNNNRRPLARLHFNRSVKYIGLFDGEQEERVPLTSTDDIYAYAERLRVTAARYVEMSST
ncbi:hypothetical protein [Cereibacter sphaeroides]|nr:hypothetical protein [Cereibacter sphaeroides]